MGMLDMFRRTRIDLPSIEKVRVNVADLDQSYHALLQASQEVQAAASDVADMLAEKLANSEHRFLWTIDSLHDLVIIKDGAGVWTTVNKVGQEVFGLYHGEYLSKTDTMLAEEYPFYAETLLFCVKTDNQAWTEGKAVRTQERVPAGTGFRYFDVIKTPTYESDGSRKELIIVGRDITESYLRSKREKACFQALNAASDAIAIIDSKARVFFCNDEFVAKFDLGCYTNVVGLDIMQVVSNFPKYDDMWGIVQKNQEWSTTCPDSKTKLTVLPMMNGQPKPIYYICTFKAKYQPEPETEQA